MYTPLRESLGKEKLTIICGGPGSGRRSEGGHEIGDKVYVHPNYGGGSGKVTEVSNDGKYVTVKGKEGEDIHHFSDLSSKPFKVNAGAATVGRPTGVDGKKMTPRRARVTKKELEKLNTKGLKAGGPGSGRHSGEATHSSKPINNSLHQHLVNKGFKLLSTHNDYSEKASTYEHPKKGSIDTFRNGEYNHHAQNGSLIGSGKGLKDLSNYLK